MATLKELIDDRAKKIADNRKLLNAADSEKRELTAEEKGQYDRADKDIESLSDQIEAKRTDDGRRERHARYEAMLTEPVGRQIPASDPSNRLGKISEAAAMKFDFGKGGTLNTEDLSDTDPRLSEMLRGRASEQYRKAFLSYVRGESKNYEKLGLQTGNDPQGGYLAPMGFVATLIKFLDDAVTMRQLGTVLPPTTAKSVGALSFDTDYADADWTAEVPASDISEDDAARLGRREMTPHLLTKLVKTSRKMLRSSTLPLEPFIAGRFAYKFGITENKAFLTGSGAQRPLGAFIASDSGVPTSRDVTCASTTTFTADELIDMRENIKDQYQQNSTWLASRTFRKMARKLKDGNGNYLLVENNAGGLSTLLDRPLMIDENAPSTFTTGLYVAMLADWSYYWIQDSLDLEIQRLDELFALKNQVGWVGRKETDGMPVLAEAFTRLKLG